jgi:two-component system nitrate/nitrite response regulator NarL
MKHTILIDDNPVDLELLKFWIENYTSYKVTRMFYSATDAIRLIDMNNTFLCVIDMCMPMLNGIETMVLLKQKGYKGKLLAVSHAYYHADRLECQKIGAHGYCEKTKESITQALFKINQVGEAFDERLYEEWEQISHVRGLYKKDEDIRLRMLNPHYKKILMFTYQGLNTTQIAEAMQLKKHTIEQYRANMLKELEFNNMCQATAWAIFNKIIIISELPPLIIRHINVIFIQNFYIH